MRPRDWLIIQTSQRIKMQITETFDITFKYQKENDTFRFEGVTENGKAALTEFFGWNCIAIECASTDGTAKDMANDLEGYNDIRVLDLRTVEAK
tara:strand:+ start:361 stop:642 length:282 start_codon:yes stop_codon:yes gene_type:complete